MNEHIKEVMIIMLDDDYNYYRELKGEKHIENMYDRIKDKDFGCGCPADSKTRKECNNSSSSCPNGSCEKCWTNTMKYIENEVIAFIKF